MHSARLGTLLVTALLLASTGAEARAQSAGDTSAAAPAGDEAAEPAPLPADAVARVDGVVVSIDAFHQYVGTVTMRFPEGEEALRALVLEQLLTARAERLGVTVTDADVDALFDELDARARAATGGEQGLIESVGDERWSALRASLRLAALQRAVVAAEEGVPVGELSEERLAGWLATTMADAAIEERPLGDPVAASWKDGVVLRSDLGRRVAEGLPREERSGLLTELLGILAIEARARSLGVAFTAEAAADELIARERLVGSDPRTVGVTYEEVVAQVEKRSLAELVASPSFRAEVLLDLLVQRTWDEDAYRELFETERAAFEERYGEGVTFEHARPGVEKLVRQRSYQQLLASSSIERRF